MLQTSDSPQGGAYPRFNEETLFLSSSSDVRPAREEAYRMLKGLLNRLVTRRRIEPFMWEVCVADKPFDQRLTMQENLGRTSDENCVGVICFFGERIGHPLRDFDPSIIEGWADWSDSQRRFRAVHPWPDDMDDQLALVGSGAFPVTGTVFEVLDAWGHGVPTYVAYFADRPITPDNPAVRLNGWTWRYKMLRELGELHADPTKSQSTWLDTAYTVQTRGVVNFINALNDRSIGIPVHQSVQDMLAGVRGFVKNDVVSEQLTEDNPYRFLDFYDILDADDLPGRQEETRKTVAELMDRARPGGLPMMARITGESGCGKTSFMRGGVLADLNKASRLGRFRVLAVRPTDFHNEHGLPDRNIPYRLLTRINDEVADLDLTAAAVIKVEDAGGFRAAQLAVDVLTEALAAKDDNAYTLVIGLDQFEEIIDDLRAVEQRSYARAWLPLLSFVERATATGRFGFVYTLESSRRQAFQDVELPEVFRQAYEVPLGNPSDAFIRTIIQQPFERAGYRLSPQVVNQLLDAYKAYRRDMRHASPLPLLALKLSNLFERIQGRLGSSKRISTVDGNPSQVFGQLQEVSHAEVKDDLNLDNEIEELANEAWGTHDKPEDELIEDLNPFLQALIRLGGDVYDTITLQTVGDDLFINLEEQLQAFEAQRLVVRENGRRRLVHEAVVRKWPPAQNWYETKREYLVEEALFRDDARRWRARGGNVDHVPTDEASIDTAMAILRNYVQEWGYADPDHLSPLDANLRAYCLAIFQHSTTPRRTNTRYFRKPYYHINVAALYGLTDLVRKFANLDPECIYQPSGGGTTPIGQAAWASVETTRFLLESGAVPVDFDEDGWSIIAAPIWQNDLEIFRLLLPHYRTAADAKAPQGRNLLHVAAQRGAVDMASALLSVVEGLDPMKKDKYGRTPLDFAAMYDHPASFAFFCRHGDVRHRSGDEMTPLHYAAANGALEVIDELLRLPEFFDLIGSANASGLTALMMAAQYRYPKAVERLAEVIDPNQQCEGSRYEGWTALHFAIAGPPGQKQETRITRHQALRTVQTLLAVPGIDPSLTTADGESPFTMSSALPHIRRALMATPSFVWDNYLPDGSTPLNHLIQSQDRPAVERRLREANMDVELLSKNGDYALHLLVGNGMQDLALSLFEKGRVNPWIINETSDIGLAAAIRHEADELVKAYLDSAPDQPNSFQRRQLSLGLRAALYVGAGEALFERLLDLGADPSMRLLKGMGWTPLHYAALLGRPGSLDLLVRYTDIPLRRDAWGRLPADLAPDHLRDTIVAQQREVEGAPYDPATERPASEHLVEDTSSESQLDNTSADDKANPLFVSARQGDLERLEVLLNDPGIDPTVRDAWGRTPADVAPSMLRTDIERLLHEASARRKG